MLQTIDTTGTTLSETSIDAIDPELLPRVAAARKHLRDFVSRGTASAGRIISKVLSEIPEDHLVLGRATNVRIEDGATPRLVGGGLDLGLHTNAQTQLAERMGVPWKYVARLLAGDAWERALAKEIMNESLHNLREGKERYLVRAVGGMARAFLSSRFKRMDSRPLLDATVQAAEQAGAVPYQGIGSDVRVSLKFVLPRVFEPVPGEVMVLGFDWRNSDYGKGPYEIRGFAMRLVCLNGMVGESDMRRIHIGGRITQDNVLLSQETLDKESAALVSATHDVVNNLLGPAQVDHHMRAIREAHGRERDFATAFRNVRKDLNKTETEQVQHDFDSDDAVILPPGKTAWRASNALSHLANLAISDGRDERGMELQELAHKVLN